MARQIKFPSVLVSKETERTFNAFLDSTSKEGSAVRMDEGSRQAAQLLFGFSALVAGFTKAALGYRSVLEANMERLGTELEDRTERKIAILGQPGCGKSSLLKKMTNGKVRPLPVIGIQTDATDWSQDDKSELLGVHGKNILVDAPGYDTDSHPTSTYQMYFPYAQFDAFIFVVNGKLHGADEKVFQRVADSGKKICVARSFSENLDASERQEAERDLRKRLAMPTSVPVFFFSNRSGEGVSEIYRHAKA